MVCGALGGTSAVGGAVVLVGMYAALSIVVTGCVRALATDLAPVESQPRVVGLMYVMLLLGSIVSALLFMAHASMRFVNHSIPQFGAFMESQGFAHGQAWVLAITCYELGAGSLLLLDRGVRWAASGLAVIVAVGIYLIHRHNGWFVGEHGVGGSEYSVALLAMLLAIAAHDADTRREQPR